MKTTTLTMTTLALLLVAGPALAKAQAEPGEGKGEPSKSEPAETKTSDEAHLSESAYAELWSAYATWCPYVVTSNGGDPPPDKVETGWVILQTVTTSEWEDVGDPQPIGDPVEMCNTLQDPIHLPVKVLKQGVKPGRISIGPSPIPDTPPSPDEPVTLEPGECYEAQLVEQQQRRGTYRDRRQYKKTTSYIPVQGNPTPPDGACPVEIDGVHYWAVTKWEWIGPVIRYWQLPYEWRYIELYQLSQTDQQANAGGGGGGGGGLVATLGLDPDPSVPFQALLGYPTLTFPTPTAATFDVEGWTEPYATVWLEAFGTGGPAAAVSVTAGADGYFTAPVTAITTSGYLVAVYSHAAIDEVTLP